MQYTLATLVLLAAVHNVAAQGVTALLTPTGSAPAGCATNYAGSFEITVVKPAEKREVIAKRACAASGTAVLDLAGSVLTDAQGRIGSIVANHQFQFDGPPAQAGAIYTGGFSVCANGSLALGSSTIFYQCLSGDFYNIYDDDSTGALCAPILIDILPCGAAAGAPQGGDGQVTASSAAPAATQAGDGQPQVSSAVTQISDGQVQASSAVAQIPDGQVQAPSAAPVSQISDGQVQVPPTPPPAPAVTQISDGQVQASSAAPVSQISDGQVQATSAAAPVSQISDGQVQATSAAAPVSQISDGQVQATSAAAPVSQISDGQVQATSAAAPVSQISDGQVQATSAAPVSQISDGQVQATSAAPVDQISDGQIQATTMVTTGRPVTQISDGQIQATSAAETAPAEASTTAVFEGAAAVQTGMGMLVGVMVGMVGVALV